MALVPVAGAIAGAAAAAAYLDAKFHISQDLNTFRVARAQEREFAKTCANRRHSLWYPFEAQVRRLPANEEAIWSRTGCYTWAETHAQACRYGQYFLQNGVKPGQLVSFYLTNQPEFVFGLLGAWGIRSAPAMMNHHLAGDALIHCLKIAGGKLLIVDEAADAIEKIEAVRDRIEGELGMTIKILDSQLKGEICRMEPKRPGDELRAVNDGTSPSAIPFSFASLSARS